MTSYHYIGLLLAVLSGVCLIAFFYTIIRQIQKRKRPLYCRKLPKVNYSDSFWQAVKDSYQITGDIRGMLQLLETKWNGKTGKRIAASLDYLNHSRYRDYETALYRYLSDGSKEGEVVLNNILELEIRKQRGLICKS